MKIVGGNTAVANSWPSIAYVKWNYKAKYSVSSGTSMTYVFSGTCGGTLIDRHTILTAAHCIQTSVKFKYAGITYTGSVSTNVYYPTISSMYTVFLGVQDKSSIDDYATVTLPAIKMTVKKVVKV